MFTAKSHKPVISSFVLAGVVAVGLSLPSFAQAEPATFTFDKGHTEIRMIWNHVGMSDQSAEFAEFDGTLTFDPSDVGASSLNVTIPAESIYTGLALFDDHMKGADFFDTANHPEITFVSTAVQQTGASSGQVTGDLTIKGVTKPVTLNVTMNFDGEHPLGKFIDVYKGKRYVSFHASTEVLRSDFNMGSFAPLTSDTVRIEISTEMAEQS